MASFPLKIGKYTVEGILGQGGMGVVYKAVDAQIGRYVAIKMITGGGDPNLLERFRSEARSTGSLQNPHIVTVYDFGEQDGNPYLVMQFLQGSSLDAIMQKGVPLTLSEKLGIIIDVCNGLAYAHQRGVIHRDIKPGNIIVLQDGVNDGMAMIVDFGIARVTGETRQTKTTQIIGSLHYMSVEQLHGKEFDHRTDIYSTAVVLFQLLTGALPFDDPEPTTVPWKILNNPPPSLSVYLKEYPAELDGILNRALAKKPQDRYGSARELAFDLEQVRERLKSEAVAQLVTRAEVAIRREEWTRAREQLQQVLRLDRQNTKAHQMMSAVQEELQKQHQMEQARGLRAQADEAFYERHYDTAIRLLDQAVTLDPSNGELQAFRESVKAAKQRETSLRRALRRADAALKDDDLDEAQSALDEALHIDPADTQAKALKLIIAQRSEEKARQEQVQKLLDIARSQIAKRDITGAFSTLKSAEELDPTSAELQIVAKNALAAREQEKRRRELEELRAQIEECLLREDFTGAVTKAESGLARFPQEQSLVRLKALADEQKQRLEQKRFVREQHSRANTLARGGNLAEAVVVLDRALQRAPGNNELESLRASLKEKLAAEESEQRRKREMHTRLATAKEILRKQGAAATREYLERHARHDLETEPVRDFYQEVCARQASDQLEAALTAEKNPQARLQMAEEAAQLHPDNELIRRRLGELKQINSQINLAVKRAHTLESEGQVREAFREWQSLNEKYPQVPDFATQVLRLTTVQEAQKRADISAARNRAQALEAEGNYAGALQDFVKNAVSRAGSLADSGDLAQSLAVLEQALEFAPGNRELENLRCRVQERIATTESQQKIPIDIDRASTQAKTIFREQGASRAKQFLEREAAGYLNSQQLGHLYRDICNREASDTLERRLSAETNPARRVQITEEAGRSYPENVLIQQRLAEAREFKANVSPRMERAEALEAQGQIAEALREWQSLRQQYPQVPEFDVRWRRLISLRDGSKAAAVAANHARTEVTGKNQDASILSTRIIDFPSEEGQQSAIDMSVEEIDPMPRPPLAAPEFGLPQRDSPARPQPLKPRLRLKLFAAVGAALVFAMLGYFQWRGTTAIVAVHFITNPPDATVTVEGHSCQAPCDLNLKKGKYRLQAEREGYSTVDKPFTAGQDTGPVNVELNPLTKNASTEATPTPVKDIAQGILLIHSNVAGATVFVDNVQKGTTDSRKLFELILPDATYQVRLEMKGFGPVTKSIKVTQSRPKRPESFDLTEIKPEDPWMTVQSEPGALVTIDGKGASTVGPNGVFKQQVPVGNHPVKVSLSGYKEYSANVTLKQGNNPPLVVMLDKIPAPIISSFEADPRSIQSGEAVELKWKTQNADEVSIAPKVGRVDPPESGSRQDKPTEPTTYTLTAKGPGGTTTETKEVNVTAPKQVSIELFDAGAGTIKEGTEVKLFWGVSNATQVYIERSVGETIGPLKGSSVALTPSKTTTYTLRAEGPGGPRRSDPVTVNVEKKTIPDESSAGLNPDASAAKQCIERFQQAYRLQSMTALLQAWPSLGTTKATERIKNAIKGSFEQAKHIDIDEQCDKPSFLGNTARITCRETLIYTDDRGKPNNPGPVSIEFVCGKNSTGWVVESRAAK